MHSVVFLGDCQALALKHVYEAYIAPLREERAKFVDLYDTGQDALAAVQSADVVVRQVFNLARSVHADQIRADATVVTFPAIFTGFLWPYSGQEAHVRNTPTALLPDGPYGHQMADKFLNGLIREKVDAEEALKRYLDLDIARAAHLDRIAEIQIDAQAARDQQTGFEFATIIKARLRDTCLFLTSSHPTLTLMAPLIRGVFRRMGVDGVDIERAICSQRATPFTNAALPIHPGVIDHFNLKFVHAQSSYPFYDEGRFTFAEFVLRYMAYTWNEALLQGISLSHGLDLDRALATLSRALQSSPASIGGWRTISAVLLAMGQSAEAISAAKRAIALDPEDPAGRFQLARTLQTSGNLEAAEEEAKRAIALFPTEASSHRLLAEILNSAGRPREAIAAAQMAVSIKPGDSGSIRLLKRLLSRSQTMLMHDAALAVSTVAAVPSLEQPAREADRSGLDVPRMSCRLHAPVGTGGTAQWYHMEDGSLGRFRWTRTAETTWPISYMGPVPALLRFIIPVVMENAPGSTSASYLRVGDSTVPLSHRERAMVGEWLVHDEPPAEVTLVAPQPQSPLALRGVNDTRLLGFAVLVADYALPTSA